MYFLVQKRIVLPKTSRKAQIKLGESLKKATVSFDITHGRYSLQNLLGNVYQTRWMAVIENLISDNMSSLIDAVSSLRSCRLNCFNMVVYKGSVFCFWNRVAANLLSISGLRRKTVILQHKGTVHCAIFRQLVSQRHCKTRFTKHGSMQLLNAMAENAETVAESRTVFYFLQRFH